MQACAKAKIQVGGSVAQQRCVALGGCMASPSPLRRSAFMPAPKLRTPDRKPMQGRDFLVQHPDKNCAKMNSVHPRRNIKGHIDTLCSNHLLIPFAPINRSPTLLSYPTISSSPSLPATLTMNSESIHTMSLDFNPELLMRRFAEPRPYAPTKTHQSPEMTMDHHSKIYPKIFKEFPDSKRTLTECDKFEAAVLRGREHHADSRFMRESTVGART